MAKKPTPREALNRAIENMGGITATAADMGVSVQAVQNWRSRGVPSTKVQRLVEGSGVEGKYLRPDLYE